MYQAIRLPSILHNETDVHRQAGGRVGMRNNGPRHGSVFKSIIFIAQSTKTRGTVPYIFFSSPNKSYNC